MKDIPTFIYVLRLVRPPETYKKIPPEEDAIVSEHFRYLKRGFAEGSVILVGRCEGAEFGIVVFRAGSQEEAKDFMKNDPAVKKGLMAAEIHPFRVALIEKG
jgi:uncharacterized protein YciI